MIDADSHEVRAVEMTDHRHGVGEIVPGLLAQLPKAERIGVISGDGAYDTKACHAAIARRNAQAIIPPRKNARAWKSSQTGSDLTQRSLTSMPTAGSSNLEKVDWLPPAQLGGDEDELPQAAR